MKAKEPAIPLSALSAIWGQVRDRRRQRRRLLALAGGCSHRQIRLPSAMTLLSKAREHSLRASTSRRAKGAPMASALPAFARSEAAAPFQDAMRP